MRRFYGVIGFYGVIWFRDTKDIPLLRAAESRNCDYYRRWGRCIKKERHGWQLAGQSLPAAPWNLLRLPLTPTHNAAHKFSSLQETATELEMPQLLVPK